MLFQARGTKRKLDHGPSAEGASVDTVYNFPERVSPPAKQAPSDRQENSLHSSVSVNIVQHLPGGAPAEQQIQLTVSSTVQTGLRGPHSPAAHTATNIQASTNICKQEPQDDSADATAHPLPDNIDIDELQAILETLEEEEGQIPSSLLEELVDKACEDSDLSDKGTPDLDKSPMFGSGPGSKASPPPGMFADPLYEPPSANQPPVGAMGGQGAAAMAYSRPPTGGGAAPPMLGDTGPAAETLKQMAAQHQSQEYGPMKGQYGPEYQDSYGRRMPATGYPAGYPNQSYSPLAAGGAQSAMYPYSHSVQGQVNGLPRTEGRQMAMGPHMAKVDPSITYGATKPLSHYPDPNGTGVPVTASSTGPSSLQQLQNQVQSHFSQAGPGQQGPAPANPHVHISQTQHMHLGASGQRMHLSQTQQMHLQGAPGQQISVAQQQSFNMAPQQQQQGHYISDQMRMRMYQENLQQQQQQQQQQAGMGGYMRRPPPDYKMGPGGVNGAYPGASMAGVNPLQTMQNMVNQTSGQPAMANGMYMKTEGGMPTRIPNAAQASPMTPGYPGGQPHQMMSQQQMMSQATNGAHPMKPGTPTYSSALMRGQRPPNVNVGPEGLNISHQRGPGGEWPRGMAPGSQGIRAPHHGSMMQYAGYQDQQAAMMGPRGPMMSQQQMAAVQQQQQQRAAMQQQQAAAGKAGMMLSQQQAMQLQQQQQAGAGAMTSITMTQSLAASSQGQAPSQHPRQPHSNPTTPHPGPSPHPPQSTPAPAATTGPQHTSQTNGSGPPPGAPPGTYPPGTANGEFPLDFLDNSQAHNQDFFDANPSLFDEIFGNK